ncbi:MAG: DUF4911 domain-containing protein [Myxococcales bacterium]|nr:DUF4911 domain-containing protein [Myxococcales bacterium]
MMDRSPSPSARNATLQYWRVGRKDVALFDALLEGYEGLATVATVDRERSILRIEIPSAFVPDVEALLASLSRTLDLARLSEAEALEHADRITGPRPRKPSDRSAP